ncbi:MAG: cytochrome d ubiquinol oxidase subunit II [Verrucomicrobiota bacterium]
MLETTIALVTFAALVLYALMGGADFGGGMWDLFAHGPRAARQRKLIADAIAPIWEANHVWLILVIVLLFTAFPRGFAAMMTALHIPLMAMLVGIVLRGSAFVFRKYDAKDDAVQRRWSTIFGVSSLITPFLQGLSLGALASGAIRVEGHQVTTGFFAGWTGGFAVACGAYALTLFAFLAAVYLTVDAHGDAEVQEDFRRRALISGVVLAPIAAVVFLAARVGGAPQMYHDLTRWWAPYLLIATSGCALTALVALWRRRYRAARVAAIGQVTLILVGWCSAQFPHVIVPDMDIYTHAAPAITLRLLVIALGAGALVLLPSLYYLFYVFKKRPS